MTPSPHKPASVCPPRAADDDESGLEGIQALAALLRLSRIVKLMRHYTDWRVMKVWPSSFCRASSDNFRVALRTAVRPIMIPAFAMGLTILLLAGALWIAEGHDKIVSFVHPCHLADPCAMP
eukprot:2606056-Prymnesium_polylepis.1